MNKLWIKISYEWADQFRTDRSTDHIDIYDYLDLLGLYETCWLSYNFDDDTDKKIFGYPSNE